MKAFKAPLQYYIAWVEHRGVSYYILINGQKQQTDVFELNKKIHLIYDSLHHCFTDDRLYPVLKMHVDSYFMDKVRFSDK